MTEAPLVQQGRGFIGPILRTALPVDEGSAFTDLLDRLDRRAPPATSITGERGKLALIPQFSRFSTKQYHQ